MTERQGPNPGSPRTAEGAGSRHRDTPRREGRPTPEQRDPEAARRQAEERATAEILALEDDLERERERAGRSVEEIQRRLEEAEARAAGDVTVTDARAREDAADRLREQRGDVPREVESERRMPARERELIAERDEMAEAPANALKRLDEHTRQLEAQIEALEAETDARIQKVVEEAEEQVRARLSAGQKDLARAEGDLARKIKKINEIKESAETRAREEVDAVRRAAELRFQSAQDEKATLQDETEKRLEAELKRLEAEADSRFDDRLAKVVTETETRMQEDAERRLREQEEMLRAEAEERVRVTTQTVRDETARQTREELERLRAELEEERDSRGKLIEEAEQRARRAEAQVAAARRGTAQAKEDADNAETDEQAAVERPKGRRGFSPGRLRPRRRRKAVEEADDAAVGTEDEAGRKPAGADDAGAEKAGKTGEIDVNEATFEQLRDLGMSVTQATRVIAYREREAGFDSVDDLDSVPGIPKPFVSELKDRLTA